jgi:hypothetical protein
MKKSYLIALVSIILLCVIAFVGYKFFRSYKKDAETKLHTEYIQQKADVIIAAKRLWVDYSMNKDIADPRYNGKIIQVEGLIMRVETVDNKVIVVFAFRRGELGDEGIRVTMLPEFNRSANGINPFKNVKIKGLCKGYNGQDIIMENGSIVGSQ